MERSVILGTAGHIDHGKTALVRALTGVDTDRLPEEKRRGITIDLGFAPLRVEGIGTVAVVDVPGHENFVRTMVAGTSGIDVALLVVAADEGLMPQSLEHLEILSLLRIPAAVIAITKCDLVDDDWIALVRADLEKVIGSGRFAGSPIVNVSVRDGSGIDALRNEIAGAARKSAERDFANDLFRLPVDRAFTVKGTGTVVTGTIWSGAISPDSSVVIQPGGKNVRVRAVQTHGERVDNASAGQRAAIALAGLDVSEVSRGSVLLDSGDWVPVREMDVSLEFLNGTALPGPRTRFRFHIGTSETNARVTRPSRTGDSAGIIARLRLEEPVVARAGDRFILRTLSPVTTVGGGEIIDPFPTAKRPAHFRGLDGLLEDAGTDGVPVAALPVRLGMPPARVNAGIESSTAVTIGSRVYSASVIERAARAVEERVRSMIRNHSLERGVSREEVRRSQHLRADVMDAVVDRLAAGKQIAVDGSHVRPWGWEARLDEADGKLRQAILHEICISPSEPPSVPELVMRHGSRVHMILRMLAAEHEVEKVSEDRFYSSRAVEASFSVLRSRMEKGRIYSPAELREVLGVTRKYLIPFLEFCDRKGVTERVQQGRALRPERMAQRSSGSLDTLPL